MCMQPVVLFILPLLSHLPIYLSVSTHLLTHLLILCLQSGCHPVQYRTPVCLRPIWKILAHPLKCIQGMTFILPFSCLSPALSLCLSSQSPLNRNMRPQMAKFFHILLNTENVHRNAHRFLCLESKKDVNPLVLFLSCSLLPLCKNCCQIPA